MTFTEKPRNHNTSVTFRTTFTIVFIQPKVFHPSFEPKRNQDKGSFSSMNFRKYFRLHKISVNKESFDCHRSTYAEETGSYTRKHHRARDRPYKDPSSIPKAETENIKPSLGCTCNIRMGSFNCNERYRFRKHIPIASRYPIRPTGSIL